MFKFKTPMCLKIITSLENITTWKKCLLRKYLEKLKKILSLFFILAFCYFFDAYDDAICTSEEEKVGIGLSSVVPANIYQ